MKRIIYLSCFSLFAAILLCSCAGKTVLDGAFEYISEDGAHSYMVFSPETVTICLEAPETTAAYSVQGKRITVNTGNDTINGLLDGDVIILSDYDIILAKTEQLYKPPADEPEPEPEPEIIEEPVYIYPEITHEIEIKNTVATDYHIINADGAAWGFADANYKTVKRSSGNPDTSRVMYVHDVRSVFATPDGAYFFIKTDDTLWGYGSNKNGQLGDNTGVDKGINDIAKIADNAANLYYISNDIVMLLKNDNTLWAWGTGIGVLTSNAQKEEMYAPYLIHSNVAEVYPTDRLVFETDGTLLTWGKNVLFSEFDDTRISNSQSAPQGLRVIAENVKNVKRIVYSNSSFYYYVKSDNALWLGGNADKLKTPVEIYQNIKDYAPSKNRCLIHTENDLLIEYAYSTGEFTERLDNVSEVFVQRPSSNNAYYAFALKQDYTLWAWGGNENGQLGDGSKIDRNNPVFIADNVRTVMLWDSYAAYLTIEGNLYCWGKDSVAPAPYFTNVSDVYIAQNGIVIYQKQFSGRLTQGSLSAKGGLSTVNTEISNVTEVIVIDNYVFYALSDDSLYELFPKTTNTAPKPLIHTQGFILQENFSKEIIVVIETPEGYWEVDISNLIGITDEKDLVFLETKMFGENEKEKRSEGRGSTPVSFETLKNEGTFDTLLLQPGFVITVYYDSDSPPHLVLKSQTEGRPHTTSRARLAPFTVNNNGTVAQYSYTDVLEAFGTDMFAEYLDELSFECTAEELGISRITIGIGMYDSPYRM